MDELKRKSLKLGASNFGISKAKNKRYYVIYKGKRINFGSKTGKTFVDHKDPKIRKAWLARHNKIFLKDGRQANKVKTQSAYWAKTLLW